MCKNKDGESSPEQYVMVTDASGSDDWGHSGGTCLCHRNTSSSEWLCEGAVMLYPLAFVKTGLGRFSPGGHTAPCGGADVGTLGLKLTRITSLCFFSMSVSNSVDFFFLLFLFLVWFAIYSFSFLR
jgi:hypothetical protein